MTGKTEAELSEELQTLRRHVADLERRLADSAASAGEPTGELSQAVSVRTLEGERQQLALRLLERLNRPGSQRNVIGAILNLLQDFTGFEAVGIRLREGEDYPYYVSSGFSEGFLEVENALCARNEKGEIIRDANDIPVLECLCGNVLSGRTDPSQPFFTESGSFWTNSTTQLLASTAEQELRSYTRSRCNREGYESVALIPLRSDDEIVGLLQLNDSRRDRLTPELVRFLEEFAAGIAVAVRRGQAEETVKEAHDELEQRVEKRTAELRKANEQLRRETRERMKGEQALDRAHTDLHQVFQATPPLAIIDKNYRMLRVNDTFCFMVGMKEDEIVGRKCREIWHGSSCGTSACTLQRILDGEERVEYEEDRAMRNGGTISCFLSATPYRGHDGELMGTIRGAVEITERKRAENALRESERLRAESERLAATGRMAARIAHEINNPLAGIANSFRLVKRAVPKDHRHYKFAEMIEKEIDRIGRIVHQMFDLYRPGQEKIEDVAVETAIKEVVAMLEPSRRQHEVRVEIDVDPPGTSVKAPEGSLRQILFNLIKNAIEASPPGSTVKITGRIVEDEEEEEDAVQIAVADQGTGVPEGVRDDIFEPFFTTKRSKNSRGVGLGLSVSKGIVDSLGGFLDWEDSPGKGATFRVTLPFATGK